MSSAPIGTSSDHGPPGLAARFAGTLNTRLIPVALFLFSTVTLCQYKPFSRFESGDNALYDYIAQSILRGQLSYRDVVDVKGPASTYLSALAMEIGRAFGASDILAVRLLYVVLAGLLCVFAYKVAEAYLESRFAAAIAALLPLMISRYDEFMTAGTEPKLPMMLFGIVSLLMIARDKPLWAGVCSMLACLSWQPGLMFTGVAFLIHSRYLTSWRDFRAVRVVIGAGIPLAIVVLYFYSRGALADLWTYTIAINYSVTGPSGEKGPGGALLHLWKVIPRTLGPETIIILIASGAGLVMYFIGRVRSKRRAVDLFRDALVMPPLIYFGFCLVNFQGGPDLIPFIAFIGLFGAWLFVEGSRLVAPDRRTLLLGRSVALRHVIPVTVLLVVLGVTLIRGHRYGIGDVWTLQREEKEARLIGSQLGPGDSVFVHGTAELLVLLNKPNLNPYLDLDAGKDDYIAQRKYGGSFQALVDEMEVAAPRIVAISRLRNVTHRVELERWVAEGYSPLELELFFGVYIRR